MTCTLSKNVSVALYICFSAAVIVTGEGHACASTIATVAATSNYLLTIQIVGSAIHFMIDTVVGAKAIQTRLGETWVLWARGAITIAAPWVWWLGNVPLALWTTMLFCIRPAMCSSTDAWWVRRGVWRDVPFDMVALCTVGMLVLQRVALASYQRHTGPCRLRARHSALQYALALLALILLSESSSWSEAFVVPTLPWVYRRWLLLVTSIQPFNPHASVFSAGSWFTVCILHGGVDMNTAIGTGGAILSCVAWAAPLGVFQKGTTSVPPTHYLQTAYWVLAALASIDTGVDVFQVRSTLAPRMDDTLKRALRIWGVWWFLILPVYVRTRSISMLMLQLIIMTGLHPNKTPTVILDALGVALLSEWTFAATLSLWYSIVAIAFATTSRLVFRSWERAWWVPSMFDAALVLYSASRIDARQTKAQLWSRHTWAIVAVTGLGAIGVGLFIPQGPYLHTNYAGVSFCASQTGSKRTVYKFEEVQDAVRNHYPLRAVGGGHSWNGFACPSPTLPGRCTAHRSSTGSSPSPLIIDMKGLRHIRFNGDRTAVICGAGATMGDIDDYLQPFDLEMTRHWWREVTIGGAVATGVTHDGASIRRCVGNLTLVTANASLVTFSPTSEDWETIFGSVGAFGVILEVEVWVTERVSRSTSTAGNMSLIETLHLRKNSTYVEVTPSCNYVKEIQMHWGESNPVRGSAGIISGIANRMFALLVTMPLHLLLLPSIYAMQICAWKGENAAGDHIDGGEMAQTVQLYAYFHCSRISQCVHEGIIDRVSVFEPVFSLKQSYMDGETDKCAIEWSVPIKWLHLVNTDAVETACHLQGGHPGKTALDYFSRARPWNPAPIISWTHTYTKPQRTLITDAMRRYDPGCTFYPQGFET